MADPIRLVAPLTATEQQKIDAVNVLRTQLERTENGKVLSVLVVTKDADDMWTHHRTASMNIREEIGALEALKFELLYRNR